MLKRLFLLLFIFGLFSCNSDKNVGHFELEKDSNYPQWLICGDSISADQTSGITYLKTDSKGTKHFLLADDIGKIHHLTILNDRILNIQPIVLSADVMEYFSGYPKLDFEEIVFDRNTGACALQQDSQVTTLEQALLNLQSLIFQVLQQSTKPHQHQKVLIHKSDIHQIESLS